MTGNGKRILVAEDSPTQAERLRLLLTGHGYRVVVAADGRQGLDLTRASPPDLIISDIVMPRLSGFELFKRVKASPTTATIPFLFITGFQDDRVLAEARKVGVFGILRKPVDIEQIENRLRELTRSKE